MRKPDKTEELHEEGETKEENPETQTKQRRNTNQRFQEAATKLQAKVFL